MPACWKFHTTARHKMIRREARQRGPPWGARQVGPGGCQPRACEVSAAPASRGARARVSRSLLRGRGCAADRQVLISCIPPHNLIFKALLERRTFSSPTPRPPPPPLPNVPRDVLHFERLWFRSRRRPSCARRVVSTFLRSLPLSFLLSTRHFVRPPIQRLVFQAAVHHGATAGAPANSLTVFSVLEQEGRAQSRSPCLAMSSRCRA